MFSINPLKGMIVVVIAVCDPLTSKEEIFLQDFLEILKLPLQNFEKIIKKIFLVTIHKPRLNNQSHTGVLPVAKGLNRVDVN